MLDRLRVYFKTKNQIDSEKERDFVKEARRALADEMQRMRRTLELRKGQDHAAD